MILRTLIVLVAMQGLLGCPAASTAGITLASTITKLELSGTVLAPTSVLPAIVAAPAAAFALLTLGEEATVPYDLVFLSDQQDVLYRNGNRIISAISDSTGVYRFQSSVPKKVPVIANAALTANRRMAALAVVDQQPVLVDITIASTYVTEFLRQQANADGKSMGNYDAKQLEALTATTKGMLVSDQLAIPDLDIGHIPDLDRAYALAVGTAQGPSDAWAALLGRRVLALQTVVGSGHAGAKGDGGLPRTAELFRPRDGVSDKAGNIYIADEGNHEVRRLDIKTGRITTFAGIGRGGFGGDGGPATLAILNTPRAVALDAQGNVFIADQGNARIRRVDAATGVITTVVGNPPADGTGGFQLVFGGDGGQAVLAQIYQPRSIAFNSTGDLFFSDSEQNTPYHTIRKVDRITGIISTVVGVPEQPGAFDGEGGPPAQAHLNFPNQIAFDAQDRLVFADTNNQCIRRVDFRTDKISVIAGVGGLAANDPDGLLATKTHLAVPYGVAVTTDGRIFFSERDKARVRTVGTDGLVHTVAGEGPDDGEGDAHLTKLNQPCDLWVDPNGDLLVADTLGSRIRRLVVRFGL